MVKRIDFLDVMGLEEVLGDVMKGCVKLIDIGDG